MLIETGRPKSRLGIAGNYFEDKVEKISWRNKMRWKYIYTNVKMDKNLNKFNKVICFLKILNQIVWRLNKYHKNCLYFAVWHLYIIVSMWAERLTVNFKAITSNNSDDIRRRFEADFVFKWTKNWMNSMFKYPIKLFNSVNSTRNHPLWLTHQIQSPIRTLHDELLFSKWILATKMFCCFNAWPHFTLLSK